jgi:glycosyltransferase involved in cell wall biosynthesis
VRVLNLSNFYPPSVLGGYELWCEEVTEGLRARGHDVSVVTTRTGAEARDDGERPWVHRVLRPEMELASRLNAIRFFTSRHADERENVQRLQALVERLAPDCILIWGMWNVHRSIPALAERLRPDRVAYYVGDYWPSLPSQFEPYWESRGRSRLARALKAPLRLVARRGLARDPRPALAFRRAMFPTAFVRDELARRGVRAVESRIVHGAIDTRPYAATASEPHVRSAASTRLLCVGRLTPDKGVHTAIEALGRLLRAHAATGIELTVVGSGAPSYEAHLRSLAEQHGVARLVRFVGAQPKSAMPRIYRGSDVFLFTSIWPEPFGRVIVEAMASGLAVVGSASGGASEILVDGDNALTVAPGDAAGLAAQVARLIESPDLRRRLAARGRQDATRRFDIRRMTSEIEVFLQQLVNENEVATAS